jgi:hypothetical protein
MNAVVSPPWLANDTRAEDYPFQDWDYIMLASWPLEIW